MQQCTVMSITSACMSWTRGVLNLTMVMFVSDYEKELSCAILKSRVVILIHGCYINTTQNTKLHSVQILILIRLHVWCFLFECRDCYTKLNSTDEWGSWDRAWNSKKSSREVTSGLILGSNDQQLQSSSYLQCNIITSHSNHSGQLCCSNHSGYMCCSNHSGHIYVLQ